MDDSKVIEKITREIVQAYEANATGKDGLARVCARRAVGWAIQEHLRIKDTSIDSPSVIDQINYLLHLSSTRPEIQEVLIHMTRKVEKDSLDEESYWPLPDVNLVEEAHWLVEELLGISIELGE